METLEANPTETEFVHNMSSKSDVENHHEVAVDVANAYEVFYHLPSSKKRK